MELCFNIETKEYELNLLSCEMKFVVIYCVYMDNLPYSKGLVDGLVDTQFDSVGIYLTINIGKVQR